jgi:hypothetical protein
MKTCQTTTIPTVDNTELECEDFHNSKCVQMIELPNDINIYFGWGDTPTLNEVVEYISTRIISLTERVTTIENNL